MNKSITVFTCTYNRAHTIGRTYESLHRQTCKDFVWLIVDDGSTDNTREVVKQWQTQEKRFEIRYKYKENGGLFSGYNTAIEEMDTELCVCIDSDDWMPDDAVEKILSIWKDKGSDNYAGIIGLDCFEDGKPIGGPFPKGLDETHLYNLYKWHEGDVKMVHRVELLKDVAPVELYEGEKFANPIYIYMKVDLKKPMLISNQSFCIVEYQDANDSMSKNILYQYAQSPKSLMRMRLLSMGDKRMSYSRRFRNAIHYVSSCMLAKDKGWLKKSPIKALTIMAAPLGAILYLYIKHAVAKKNNAYK